MKALLSVFDKTGLVEFATALHNGGFDLVSTGGTHKAIADEAGLPVQQVADLTGSPEILDGRVKTLHPAIHGGILARRDLPSHARELAEHRIEAIDLVAVNLYPFVETVSRPGATLEDALENIDIGGHTLLRAAAKNFPDVIVVVDPDDYQWLSQRLAQDAGGGVDAISFEERRSLARKAFLHVSTYDSAVARYLDDGDELSLPREMALGFRKLYDVSYGENPHQKAAFYANVLGGDGLAQAAQLQGPELSYNNILDAEAAWRAVTDFDEPAAVVIKHGNPCGLARHPDQAEAYRCAFQGDPVSAYGGILGFNRPVTAEAAEELRPVLYHVIVAPDYDHEAMTVLRRKRRNLRVLKVPLPDQAHLRPWDIRTVSGGVLFQSADRIEEDPSTWRSFTKRVPTAADLRDLDFAWKVVKHVRSNAIVVARDGALLGMGTGQPNRVTSIELALKAAGERSRGSVLASDAYMPFADNVEIAAQGGVVAIVQPGGSIRDDDVIAAADRLDVAMVFTGVRHFRH